MEWNEIINTIIITVVLPAIGFIIKAVANKAIDYLEKNTQIANHKILIEKMEAVRALLIPDIEKAYHEFSKKIKEDLADGKITKEEAKKSLKEIGELIIEEFKEDYPEYVEAIGLGKVKKQADAIYESIKAAFVEK